MQCDECGKIFIEKYDGQTLCGRCYYEEHPEKDYTKASKERLWGALGMKPPRSARSFQGYNCTETKGISDDELVAEGFDALPTSDGAGIVPKRLKVGEKMPDGSVFIGKFPIDNHKI